MPEIAGYANLAHIKGQYYRYAAAPKPVVFTGNIDEISENMLIKAMFVSRNQASGTFPTNIGDTFLITTVKYGNNAYLQTAYLVQTGFECYEYRRIYSGEWTSWIGVDSAINEAVDLAQNAKDAADSSAQAVNLLSGTVSGLGTDVNTIKNSTLPGLNTAVNTLSGRVQTVENKTANCGKKPVRIFNGTLANSSITISDGYKTNYTSYLILAKVQDKSDASLVSQTILRSMLTSSNVSYCISDEAWYLSYFLRYNGNDLIMTFRAGNKSGYIKEVWGVY